MKKLLSFLGAAVISTSAVTSLGLQYANKEQSSVIKKIQNYVDVSSILARATILSQNPSDATGVQTGGQGFSLNYASQYIDSREIGDFFPSEVSLRGAPKSTKTRTLLGSMFNYPSNNDAGPFVPTLTDSNLSLNEPTVGKTGNSDLVNTLSLVSGALELLFGNDFNEGLAGTIDGLLKSNALDGIGNSIRDSIGQIGSTYLKNPATNAWIFDEFSNIWSEDDLTTAYPDKAFTDLTFSEVFQVRQNDFWKGISRILYSGYGAEWKSADEAITSASTSLDKAKAAVTTQDAAFKIEFNGILIEGLANLIRYLRTLGVFYDSLISAAMPIDLVTKRNHLFDNNDENGVWLDKQIQKNYAKSENIVINGATNKQKISLWSQEKMPDGSLKYYQLINVQSLVQFFMKLLVVDSKNDPNSYETQRVFAILLGVPLKENNSPIKDPNVDNPFADVALAPLLSAIADQFAGKVELPLGIKITGAGDLVRQLLGFLRVALADSKPMWEKTFPLTNDAKVQATIIVPIANIKQSDGPFSFSSYLEMLVTQIRDNINKISIGDLEEIKKMVQAIYSSVMNFVAQINEEQGFNLPYDKQNFGNPFRGLISGELLPKIYDLIDSTNLIKIPDFIRTAIPNLNKLLTTPLGEVLGAFGLPVDSWPIYLYGLKDKTISEVVSTIGDRFDTKRYLSLDKNQSYLLNTRALERVFKPLNDQVTITFKNGIPAGLENLFTGNNTNEVVAILIAISYRDQIDSVQIVGSTEPAATTSFLSYILGIQKDNNGNYTYRDGSLFNALEKLYGHKNTEEPPALRLASKVTLQKIINNFSALVEWMRNTSIADYIDTFFTPYFLKGWKTKYLASANLDQPNQAAFIEYNLIYTLDKNPPITYKVRLERDSWTPNNKDPWFNYGIWKLYSINRL